MGNPIRVLIVEDSENDALLLVRELWRGGFEPEFERVETAAAMAAALAEQRWDLVLSDYSMPHFSGIAALQILNQSGVDIPFIIVSGAIGEDVAVAAMKAGAHDYMMKGNLTRLIPSIERELREADVRHQRRRADEEAKRNMEGIKALHEIDLAITSSLDLRSVLDVLLEKIDLFLPHTVAAVRLVNKITGTLEAVACRNIEEEEWKQKTSKATELEMMILQKKAPVMVRNAQTDPRSLMPEFLRKNGLVSFLGLPLIAKGEVLGILTFFTTREHEFAKEEIDFLSALAGQAAIAIHNAWLYEEISKQVVELEKSNKIKDEFLSVISHELRTPLNVTIGYTSVVKDGLFGEINSQQKEALEKALRHSDDLLKMINAILIVRNMEADAVQSQSGEVSLKDLLEGLKTECSVPPEKTIELIWDYPGDLPVVRTDHAKLKHILQTIMNNAIKFTERGHVALAARYIPQTNAVEFRISDSGIGIAAEKLPFIFERFQQLDSSRTRKYAGMGLGLFIAKKFTEALGGRIAVESELDKGSSFTITIPSQVTACEEPHPDTCRLAAKTLSSAPSWRPL
jgi:signal transduction histidine kinase/FixJ family two-component response regulator